MGLKPKHNKRIREKNISIGLHGYNLFKAYNKKTINILTHCNAGWITYSYALGGD